MKLALIFKIELLSSFHAKNRRILVLIQRKVPRSNFTFNLCDSFQLFLCGSLREKIRYSYSDTSGRTYFIPTYFLISFNFINASTGVNVLISIFSISSLICMRTGSSSWKKLSCILESSAMAFASFLRSPL